MPTCAVSGRRYPTMSPRGPIDVLRAGGQWQAACFETRCEAGAPASSSLRLLSQGFLSPAPSPQPRPWRQPPRLPAILPTAVTPPRPRPRATTPRPHLNMRLKGKGSLMSFLVSGALTPYLVSAAPSSAAPSSPTRASRSRASCWGVAGGGRGCGGLQLGHQEGLAGEGTGW